MAEHIIDKMKYSNEIYKFQDSTIIRSTADPTNASSYPTDAIWIKYGTDPMTTMGDYITDTGTSGIWTWEKWASGKAECWGYDTINETLTHSQGGLYYGAAHSAQFPTGFFVGSHGGKSGLQSCQISVDGNALLWYYTGSSYVHTQTYYLANPASISGTFYVYYHAIGWWK